MEQNFRYGHTMHVHGAEWQLVIQKKIIILSWCTLTIPAPAPYAATVPLNPWSSTSTNHRHGHEAWSYKAEVKPKLLYFNIHETEAFAGLESWSRSFLKLCWSFITFSKAKAQSKAASHPCLTDVWPATKPPKSLLHNQTQPLYIKKHVRSWVK